MYNTYRRRHIQKKKTFSGENKKIHEEKSVFFRKKECFKNAFRKQTYSEKKTVRIKLFGNPSALLR